MSWRGRVPLQVAANSTRRATCERGIRSTVPNVPFDRFAVWLPPVATGPACQPHSKLTGIDAWHAEGQAFESPLAPPHVRGRFRSWKPAFSYARTAAKYSSRSFRIVPDCEGDRGKTRHRKRGARTACQNRADWSRPARSTRLMTLHIVIIAGRRLINMAAGQVLRPRVPPGTTPADSIRRETVAARQQVLRQARRVGAGPRGGRTLRIHPVSPIPPYNTCIPTMVRGAHRARERNDV
jgi:hypothetical protein